MRPTLFLFSDPNLLSYYFIDQLLLKGLRIVVFSKDSLAWNKGPIRIRENSSLSFVKLSDQYVGTADYSVSLFYLPEVLGENLENNFKKQKEAILQKCATTPKNLFVFPYISEKSKHQEVLATIRSLQQMNLPGKRFVFVGDLFGRGMNVHDKRGVTKLLLQTAQTKRVSFDEEEVYFPISCEIAAGEIIRELFSWPSGILPSVYFSKLTASQLISSLIRIDQNILLIRESEKSRFAPLPIKAVEHNLAFLGQFQMNSLESVVSWIRMAESRETKPSLGKKVPRKWIAIVFLFLFFTLSPFLAFLAGGGAGALGLELLKREKLSLVNSTLSISKELFGFSQKGFGYYSYVPFIGASFDNLVSISEVFKKLTGSAKRGVLVFALSRDLEASIFGKKKIDLEVLTKNISLELGEMEKELSFVEGDIKQIPFLGSFFESKLSFSEIRKYISAGKVVSENLPELLGSTSTKTYLILFQNNMELRPTGGFIGSFGLATFSNGEMIDISVMDVYEADGQLKGHVEPPVPIKNYLGEANWYLRDSNWDPDFETSAKRAQWFLEKEMDRKVDGVIAVDLFVAKSILSKTGGVRLIDFGGEEINEKNLYEKVQHEVEANFFPGSAKKASYLTALSKALLERLKEGDGGLEIAAAFFDNFLQKHIQLQTNNAEVQKAIESINWDGGVQPSDLFVSLIDANIGVNKANYALSRSMDLSLVKRGSGVFYTLSVNLVNRNEESLDISKRYKGYLRAISLSSSVFEKIEILGPGSERKEFAPEIFETPASKEAGVVVEVPPGQERTVVFRFFHPLENKNTYNLFWRKQAGTDADNISISSSLTEGQTFLYNTPLTRDLNLQIKK